MGGGGIEPPEAEARRFTVSAATLYGIPTHESCQSRTRTCMFLAKRAVNSRLPYHSAHLAIEKWIRVRWNVHWPDFLLWTAGDCFNLRTNLCQSFYFRLSEKGRKLSSIQNLVRVVGLEPTRPKGQLILSQSRLPLRHTRK